MEDNQEEIIIAEPTASTTVYYYAASTGGFYNSSVHGTDIPADSVIITEEYWQELLNGQSAGKVIKPDENGYPILVDPPPPTLEQITADALAKRAALMSEATAAIAPLQDAVDLGEATPQEEALLLQWKQYRIALNRLTTSAGWPTDIQWPTKPA